MEYLVTVDGLMHMRTVVADKAEELGPLGPGEYRFIKINSPIAGTDGYWIVLKDEYKTGVIIGRHVASIEARYQVEEGFTVTEIPTRQLTTR